MENKNRIRLLIAVVVIGAAILVAMLISRSADRQSFEPNNVAEEGAELGEIGSYSAEDQAVFENFLRENLSSLSPEKEVLGGTFYLTNIVWMTDRDATIDYEDGHIALRASVGFSFINEDKTEVQADYFTIIPADASSAEDLGEVVQEEPVIEDYLEPINEAMPLEAEETTTN